MLPGNDNRITAAILGSQKAGNQEKVSCFFAPVFVKCCYENTKRFFGELCQIFLPVRRNNVGAGKSYFAGCIANALMEREISVCMTNFALILNDLAVSYKDRNEYIDRLCRFPLLILDDFGMERGTEYGLEQVYNVVDSRYRSNKPLIVTTNLTLEELQNPEDTPRARIYDRLLEMCSPVCFTGENFRKATAQEKMERLKTLMNRKESL